MATSFWQKVDRTGECWEWLGYRNYGYGVWHPHRGVKHQAHRYAYEEMVGTVPAGLVLDHLCRNRGCVNPAHLEPVTIGENVLRGETIAAALLARTACSRGHDYTPANTRIRRGARECIECSRRQHRESYRRVRAARAG